MATGDRDDKGQEPEVVFEPSPQLIERVNEEEGSTVARARAKDEQSEPEGGAHQYDPDKVEYPGQPRIPERDEGPPLPPTLEELDDANARAADAGETLRDRSAYREAAGVYVYEGTDATILPGGLGPAAPGQEFDLRGVQDPNVLKLLHEAADDLQLKKKG